MTLDEMQRLVETLDVSHGRIEQLEYLILDLTAEVGKVAKVAIRDSGGGSERIAIIEGQQLANVLLSLIRLANGANIQLDKEFASQVQKIKG